MANDQKLKEWEQIVWKAFSNNLTPIFNGQLYDWAKDNVNLPPAYAIQGSFNVNTSPYLKKPMECLLAPNIREVLSISATQCFAKGTRVLMYNGTIKNIEDIKAGEFVIGDDGTSRKVNYTHIGKDELFQIVPQGKYANSYIVSKEHIMCFNKRLRGKQIEKTDMLLMDYLTLSPNLQTRKYFGYQASVNWEYKPVVLDPYFLGVWLGDGDSRIPKITNTDIEIEEYLYKYAKSIGMDIHQWKDKRSNAIYYNIKHNPRKPRNWLKEQLKSLNVLQNKYIPQEYLCNSRSVRLQVLAGLFDTDGHKPIREKQKNCGELAFVSKQLADDVVYLCRSLGIRTSIKKKKSKCQNGVTGFHYRISLYGDLSIIPTKIKRKQYTSNKLFNIPSNYGIRVKPLGIGNYYGINIEGNGRFLLEDFSVVHNTGKTLIREIFIPFIILQEPGPVLALSQNDDVAKEFAETRLIPLLKNNKKINALLENDRFQARKSGIVLPHMAIKCCGSSENNLHSKSIKYLLLDETWLMENGTIEKAKARTTAFNNTKKIYISSQPGVEGDDTSKEMNKGEIWEWQWKCKKCKCIQPYVWRGEEDGRKYGLQFNEDKVKANGDMDFEAMSTTGRLICMSCFNSVYDTFAERRELNDNGSYVKIKDGNTEIVTFIWPGFVNTTISFKQMIMQYLEAKNVFRTTGNNNLMKLFTQQVLGKEWKQNTLIEVPRILNYKFAKDETWPDETHRFISVDYQRINGIKFYIVRSWSSKTKESRLLEQGYVTNWDELIALATKYKVPPHCIGIDAGHNATEVYGESIRHGQMLVFGKNKIWAGWICLKGDQKEDYKHKDGSIKYYSQEVQGDPNFAFGDKYRGIMARLHLWSNFSIKNILANLRDNNVNGFKWTTDTTDKSYIEQLHSEVLKDFIDAKTNTTKQMWVKVNDNNHLWDCECMNLTMAIMAGAFNTGEFVVDKKDIIDTTIV